MPCARCGHILGPFDVECPECIKRRVTDEAQPPTKPSPFTSPDSSSVVTAASASLLRWKGLTFSPPFDWPATIILAVTCFISSIAAIFWLFTLVMSQVPGSAAGAGAGRDVVHVFARFIAPLCLLFILGYTGKALSGVAFLLLKRWGFFCFLPCSIIIGLLNIIIALQCMNMIWLVLLFISDALPAYLVYYYGREHEQELE